MSRKRKASVEIRPDDHVLIGTERYSMPGDWFLARVLWTDCKEVLTEHPPHGGMPLYRQVLDIDQIRAVGDLGLLAQFKDDARKAVAAERERVSAMEAELGRARDAVWAKLAEIGAASAKRLEDTPNV